MTPVESPSATPSAEETGDAALLSLDWVYDAGEGLDLRQYISVEDDEWTLLVAGDDSAYAVLLDPTTGTETDRQALEGLSWSDACAPAEATMLCSNHGDDTFVVVDRATFEVTATIPAGVLMGILVDRGPSAQRDKPVGGWFLAGDVLTVLDPAGKVTESWTGVAESLGGEPLLWNGNYYRGNQILPAGGGVATTSASPLPEVVLSPTRAVARTADASGWVLLDENLTPLATVGTSDGTSFDPIDSGEDCAFIDQPGVGSDEPRVAHLLDRETFAVTPLSETLAMGPTASAVCRDGEIIATLTPDGEWDAQLYRIAPDGTVTHLSEDVREIVNGLEGDLVLAEGGNRAYVLDVGTGEILEQVEDLDLLDELLPELLDVAPLYVQRTDGTLRAYRSHIDS
ncbi:hypothetical protein [Cellulomonas soli]